MNAAGSPPSDLKPRIASAAVLIVVVGFVAWMGGIVFAAAMCALGAVLYFEWTRMTVLPTQAVSVIWGAATLVVASAFLLAGNVPGALWWAAGSALLLAIAANFRWITTLSLTRSKWVITGLAYSLAAAGSLIVIRGADTTSLSVADLAGDRGLMLLAFLFLTVWATDILAYFVGRNVGGPKLMPAVSPKKTISGALGGIAGAVLVGLLFGAVPDGFGTTGFVALAIVLSVVSQIGDLFESWIKRRYEVKDSSNLIPGHGGFMDRVDGLVFAAVPLALYVAATS